MEAVLVMRRLGRILLPLGKRKFKIGDVFAAGALCPNDRGIDENTAEIMGWIEAFQAVACDAIDVVPFAFDDFISRINAVSIPMST